MNDLAAPGSRREGSASTAPRNKATRRSPSPSSAIPACTDGLTARRARAIVMPADHSAVVFRRNTGPGSWPPGLRGADLGRRGLLHGEDAGIELRPAVVAVVDPHGDEALRAGGDAPVLAVPAHLQLGDRGAQG